MKSRHNKSNVADGCHIENVFFAISRRFIAQLTQNLVRRSTIIFRHKHKSRDQNTKFRKFKMADGRH